jgi:hypothetical protein
MRHPLSKPCRLAALLALASCASFAQDSGFDVKLNTRAGIELSSNPDNLQQRMFGLGIEVGYALAFGKLSAEVGYQYKPGNQYLTDVMATRLSTAFGDYPVIDPTFSVDSKKNRVAGIYGRLTYEMPFSNSKWSAKVGVQVGGAQFRQEYIGQTYGWWDDASITADYLDSYVGQLQKTAMAVSPFIGMNYRIDPNSSVSVELISIAYTSINYNHIAASTSGYNTRNDPHFETTQSQSRPHLVVGYSFHF